MKTAIAIRGSVAAALILLVLMPWASRADHGAGHSLTLVQATAVMDAALTRARGVEAPGAAIAVVDSGGHLVLLRRLDDTFPAAAEIAIGKARTAALFKKPTRDFEKIINDGRTTMVGLSSLVGFTPLQGGVPLVLDGRVMGAIGVSGAASAAQDDEIAEAAGRAFAEGFEVAARVLHLDAPLVTAAFRRGAPLSEAAGYKVHASRRDRAGEAEIHLHDTDVFYVLEGRATFVTGGTLRDGRDTGFGEIRGNAIDGGSERTLARGDVVVVPKGVPHWFKSVSRPLTYFVVKSTG